MPAAAALSTSEKKALTRTFHGDELSYTLGVMNLGFTCFIVGRWPEMYWLVHTVKTIVLFTIRYFRFKRRNYELYLFDFCYFASCKLSP